LSLPSILTDGALVLTIALVVTQPGFVNEGIAGMVGALLALAIGTARLSDIVQATESTASVLVFLIAMMIVATVVAATGFFEWAAHRAVLIARGDGRVLFLLLYLLGGVVTVFLSLDVTAIVVAPIVATIVKRYGLSPLPYLLAIAYVANNASLFLPVSNLTNMLVYSLLGIGFWDFVRLMTVPNLVAMLVNLIIFFLLFRGSLPTRFHDHRTMESDFDNGNPLHGAVGLGVVVVAMLVFGAFGWPLEFPAVAGAIVLSSLALARGMVDGRALARGVAWSLPPFVIGMYTITAAASRSGLGNLWTALFAGSVDSLGRFLAIVAAAGIGSNLVNNLPAALAAISGLDGVPATARLAPAFAVLIGTNLGPQITVFGSLATMLVLRAGREAGYQIPFRTYVRVGILTLPPMLLAAGLVLWYEVR